MKLCVVLTIVAATLTSAECSVATGPTAVSVNSATTCPNATANPASDISVSSRPTRNRETLPNLTSPLIQTYYSAFKNDLSRGIAEFDSILRHRDIEKLKKWTEILSVGSTNGGQWMNYYLLVKALEYGEFEFAISIWNELFETSESRSLCTKTIQLLMTGGIMGKYTDILTLLFKARKRLEMPGDQQYIAILQAKMVKFIYQDDYNVHSGMETRALLDMSASAVNKIKLYAGLMKAENREIRSVVNKIVGCSLVDVANIALNKFLIGDFESGPRRLAENGIWEKVMHPVIMKLLRNHFKIPIFFSFEHKIITARSRIYMICPRNERRNLLDLLKFEPGSADQQEHDTLFMTDKDMTMREALMLQRPILVEAYFTRPTVVRSDYDPKWIIFAIKFSTKECLKILLEERVPFPSVEDLNAAYAWAKESGTKRLIESYSANYAFLPATFASLDEFYRQNMLFNPSMPQSLTDNTPNQVVETENSESGSESESDSDLDLDLEEDWNDLSSEPESEAKSSDAAPAAPTLRFTSLFLDVNQTGNREVSLFNRLKNIH